MFATLFLTIGIRMDLDRQSISQRRQVKFWLSSLGLSLPSETRTILQCSWLLAAYQQRFCHHSESIYDLICSIKCYRCIHSSACRSTNLKYPNQWRTVAGTTQCWPGSCWFSRGNLRALGSLKYSRWRNDTLPPVLVTNKTSTREEANSLGKKCRRLGEKAH